MCPSTWTRLQQKWLDHSANWKTCGTLYADEEGSKSTLLCVLSQFFTGYRTPIHHEIFHDEQSYASNKDGGRQDGQSVHAVERRDRAGSPEKLL